jgi:IS30 family transposase
VRWIPLTADEVGTIWAQWRAGVPQRAIARALGRPPGTVYHTIRAAGGLPPRPRRRAARALTLGEREEIACGLAAGVSLRALSRQLGRAPSTLSREVRRQGGRTHYRASRADAAAAQAARRPQPCRLARHPRLARLVARRLAQRWSPEQIAGWLRRTYADPRMQVSHETIYRTLFVQSRGALRATLQQHLRRGAAFRRPRRRPADGRGQIVGAVPICARPPEVADRAVPGHWEGDLLVGARHSCIATLVERQSRYVMLVRLPSRDTATVVPALARSVRTLPRSLRRSLTWDRGPELAAHAHFTVATDVQVYFCDPRSPWQRGSNENTNGLLRQYFPRPMDLRSISPARLTAVARALNTRPRKTLNYQTPAEVLASIVALTS